MSMMAACKLLHLLEAFSTPWFLFSTPSNHHLVFFLLEMFNNIIQYQFDGNANLVYTVIRKRQVFHALANLPTDCGAINKTLTRRGKKQPQQQPQTAASSRSVSRQSSTASSVPQSPTEIKELPNSQSSAPLEATNTKPATTAEPGTYKASLMEVPTIDKLTEKASAHPSQQQLDRLTKAGPSAALFSTGPPTASGGVQQEGQNGLAGARQLVAEGQQQPQPTTLSLESYAASKRVSSSPQCWSNSTGPQSPTKTVQQPQQPHNQEVAVVASTEPWVPTQDWVAAWKTKLPLQTIMRLLQVHP